MEVTGLGAAEFKGLALAHLIPFSVSSLFCRGMGISAGRGTFRTGRAAMSHLEIIEAYVVGCQGV